MSEGYTGKREGEISTDSQNNWLSREKKEAGRRGDRGEGGCISPENMSYLRAEEGKQGQAGQREERRAFFSQQQNVLWRLMATSQALFFRFRFRKSWREAWSTSFQCRHPAPERGCVIVAARGWRLWGTQQRRCLLSSWPQSSSCWALLSVEGGGNEIPWGECFPVD